MAAKHEWTRPYWHTDAKWVFGILFSITLAINLLFFVLAKLTSENVAIPVATTLVAQQFSREGLDAQGDIEEVRQEFLDTGQERFYPFGEEQDVYLTIQDVNTLSPRQIRLKIFRQVVEPVYYKQSGSLDLKQYGFLALLNIDTHNTLQNIYTASFIPLGLFLAGFVYFSYRYGRLINPTMPLILLSALPALFFYLVQNTTPPEGDDGPLSLIPKETLTEVVRPISGIFYLYLSVGILLIIAAIAIKLFSKKSRKTKI